MKLCKPIYFALLVLCLASCQEVPQRIDNGRVVASVAGRTLQLGEIKAALPLGVSREDSVDFANLYVERWIARQIKVREAERIFSSSVQEVEAMVAAYRNSLLTHKLDQYYVDSSNGIEPKESEIIGYYSANMSSFKLDGTIVKGSILRIPKVYSDAKRLLTLMKASDEDSRLDLISICEKSGVCNFEEYTSSWMPYTDFIAMLPVVRGSGSGQYLKQRGVQTLEDEEYIYHFEIPSYRSEGFVAPLEIVRADISRILTKQRQKELIQSREEQLYKRAKAEGVIRRYDETNETSGVGSDGRASLFAPALIE